MRKPRKGLLTNRRSVVGLLDDKLGDLQMPFIQWEVCQPRDDIEPLYELHDMADDVVDAIKEEFKRILKC